ncbi:MAG: MYXO-CTERM sorting domain-containing protein [Kofleriaceae bacterium]
MTYAKAVLAAYGQIPYGASYVSQSWPLASAPALQVACGESVAATITLKNTGTNAWNDNTKLGTTEPRDRESIFAGADWDAPNRAAASGTVAPGANGTFTFAFDGPTGAACVPGTYHEHFGLVQDGTAWFSDNGGGGPPDDQIEALIELVPGDGMTGSDGGSNTSGGGEDGGTGGGTGNQSVGCNAGGASGLGSLLLVGLAVVRRRRR